MDAAYLLSIGFIVGLSGAMMPGPLLVYTISQSMRTGWRAGVRIVAGHALVEVALMAFLVLGLSALMSSGPLVRWVSLLGGAYMAYTAAGMARGKGDIQGGENPSRSGPLAGGILFTALNPGFPIWWATAGAALLLEGMRQGGLPGAALVVVGHWGADFGYFTLVSALAAKGRERALERHAHAVRWLLSSILFVLGFYFALKGLGLSL